MMITNKTNFYEHCPINSTFFSNQDIFLITAGTTVLMLTALGGCKNLMAGSTHRNFTLILGSLIGSLTATALKINNIFVDICAKLFCENPICGSHLFNEKEIVVVSTATATFFTMACLGCQDLQNKERLKITLKVGAIIALASASLLLINNIFVPCDCLD